MRYFLLTIYPQTRLNNKYSVYTTKKTHLPITKISCLTTLKKKKVTAIFSQDHKKPVSTICQQNAQLLIIKAGFTRGHHGAKMNEWARSLYLAQVRFTMRRPWLGLQPY